jgi:allantoicase
MTIQEIQNLKLKKGNKIYVEFGSRQKEATILSISKCKFKEKRFFNSAKNFWEDGAEFEDIKIKIQPEGAIDYYEVYGHQIGKIEVR